MRKADGFLLRRTLLRRGVACRNGRMRLADRLRFALRRNRRVQHFLNLRFSCRRHVVRRLSGDLSGGGWRRFFSNRRGWNSLPGDGVRDGFGSGRDNGWLTSDRRLNRRGVIGIHQRDRRFRLRFSLLHSVSWLCFSHICLLLVFSLLCFSNLSLFHIASWLCFGYLCLLQLFSRLCFSNVCLLCLSHIHLWRSLSDRRRSFSRGGRQRDSACGLLLAVVRCILLRFLHLCWLSNRIAYPDFAGGHLWRRCGGGQRHGGLARVTLITIATTTLTADAQVARRTARAAWHIAVVAVFRLILFDQCWLFALRRAAYSLWLRLNDFRCRLLALTANTHFLRQLARLAARHNLNALIILRFRGLGDISNGWLNGFARFLLRAFLFLTTALALGTLFAALLLLLFALLARFVAQNRATLFARFVL